MVLISNDEDDLFASTDDRLRSRLTECERIHFRPYHGSELVVILNNCVRWGLTDDVINNAHLKKTTDVLPWAIYTISLSSIDDTPPRGQLTDDGMNLIADAVNDMI